MSRSERRSRTAVGSLAQDPRAGRGVARIAAALLGAALLAATSAAGAGAQTMDDHIYTYVSFDEMEIAPGSDERHAEYDGQAWIGGDFNKLWLRLQGEHATRGGAGEVQGQALYSRVIHPFWDLQGGVRVDGLYGAGDDRARAHLAVGLEGLAPYWFEVEAFGFVSHEGDVSARLETSYELLFTQRLVLEPEVELEASLQDVPEWGIASGLTDLELGARLRYEIVREFAPYVGWSWNRRLGGTADLAAAEGEPRGEGVFVAGIRWWY